MASIYEIVADCRALQSLADELLTDPDTGEVRELTDEERADFLEWLNENEQNFENKMNNIYKAFKNKQAEADVAEAERKTLKDEMDRLSKRAKARENEAGRIKGLFAYALESLGMRKYKTPLFSIGWQDTRKSAKPIEGFFQPDNIPVEFLKRELSPSAINEAVKEGRLYEKDEPLSRGSLYYRENGEEKKLAGVSYLGGTSLVVR